MLSSPVVIFFSSYFTFLVFLFERKKKPPFTKLIKYKGSFYLGPICLETIHTQILLKKCKCTNFSFCFAVFYFCPIKIFKKPSIIKCLLSFRIICKKKIKHSWMCCFRLIIFFACMEISFSIFIFICSKNQVALSVRTLFFVFINLKDCS